MTTVTFLGATGTVTGSKFLVEHDGFRLLVDCGLFQGLKELRLRNWEEPPVDPARLDMILLTHAHLDHTGYLPVLMRRGFRGPVLATSATCDLCGVILPDAGYLQEEDARFANKKGFSKHRPALPLFTEEQARQSLAYLRPMQFGTELRLRDGITLRFLPAGHIPGAACLELRFGNGRRPGEGKVLLFSGDLGRYEQPIVPDPDPLPACDHLICESTYGDRDHPSEDPKDRLHRIIRETTDAGGCLLIPAFAVGRTQTLLYLLRELQQEGRLPKSIPIHVDSPMAIHATRILMSHPEAQDAEMRSKSARGDDPLGLENVHLDCTVDQSKALNELAPPAIVLSASGMAEGGRVLHHLAYKLPDRRNTVLLVGFQAEGTRGRALQNGAAMLKIHGQEVPIRARVETLDSLSAHADRGEILRWVKTAKRRPGRVHLVHGEPPAAAALAQRMRDEEKLEVSIPKYLEKVRI
jgi:metallo-beta-lactamase family protein